MLKEIAVVSVCFIGISLSYELLLPGRPHITLYEHANYKGKKYLEILGPRCYNLPEVVSDWASSINTNHRCAVLCDRSDCKGRCVKMGRGSIGHRQLSDVGLNDAVRSLKPCRAPIEIVDF